MPSRSTLEALRLPVALVLLAVALAILLPRIGTGTDSAGGPSPPAATATPVPVALGGLSGEVASPTPSPSPSPTPSPTPEPTPTPQNGASAGVELLACRRIDGARCRDELDDLERNGRFTALVRFDAAHAGDTVEVVLRGPAGDVSGGPYTLDGSGEGYYYATFTAGGLPEGTYTLVALWNDSEAAALTLER
jgi:hypothetical protein